MNDNEEIEYGMALVVWLPDGTCYEESSTSISAQEYKELFGRFILKQESKTEYSLHAALKAQTKKVQELERENEHLAMENQFLNSKIDEYVEYFMKQGGEE